jgi:hypothetical protein
MGSTHACVPLDKADLYISNDRSGPLLQTPYVTDAVCFMSLIFRPCLDYQASRVFDPNKLQLPNLPQRGIHIYMCVC